MYEKANFNIAFVQFYFSYYEMKYFLVTKSINNFQWIVLDEILEEYCPAHSCIAASKCSERKLSQKCNADGDVCCSKSKY